MKPGAALACLWCKGALAAPSRIKIGSTIVVLSPQTRLYPHHVGDTADFSAPIAELVPHPKKPNTWGLKNLTGRPWNYTTGDGSTHSVDPGQAAPVREGLQIQFGRAQGTIRG
jgi:hypothetical protein